LSEGRKAKPVPSASAPPPASNMPRRDIRFTKRSPFSRNGTIGPDKRQCYIAPISRVNIGEATIRNSHFTFVTASVLLISAASAQASQTTNSVSLNAPDDHLAIWHGGDVKAFNSAHAVVTLNRLDEADGAITPSFTLSFTNGDERETVYIANDDDGRHIDVVVQHFQNGAKTDDGGSFVTALDLRMGTSFDLAFDWADGKQFNVKLNGDEAISTPIDATPADLQLVATGGAIDMKPLELAHP
jgi:hypothetical protein